MARRKNDISDQQIIEAYLRLKNGTKTAMELGISDKTVYRALDISGIPRTGLTEHYDRIRLLDDNKRAELTELYRTGLSASAIARRLGCTTGVVIDGLREAGSEIRSSTRRMSSEEKLKAKALYESGLTLKKVADELGRREATITRMMYATWPTVMRPRHRRGAESPMWKGGRTLHHEGYVYVRLDRDDPLFVMAAKSGLVPEHRLVMARSLGRPLLPHETIHHVNGDKTDNRLENLQLRNGRHGKGNAMVCLDCGSHNVGHAKLG